ncbi:MAG: response regulator [Deltaproteobacteria bacterium]|nr:response regulator [Deltaproteobacteria bacterium]
MATRNILVVGDERVLAKDLQLQLQQLGYAVPITVASGEAAIQRVAEVRPELVLMDIHLAGKMDGIEAARRIWTEFRIPIVYLTAYADEETVRRTKLTEPVAYLLKPFTIRELQAAIEMALYRHTMDQALRSSHATNRALIDALPDWLFRIDSDGVVINYKAGKSPEVPLAADEFIGKPITAVLPPSVAGQLQSCMRAALTTNETQSFEYTQTRTAPPRSYEARVVVSAPAEVLMIVRDVTTRKEAEDALHRAHKDLARKAVALEAANVELAEYAYAASHDLKTPLRAIHNYVTFLQHDLVKVVSGEQKTYLEGLSRAVRQSEALVNDLLALSQVGSKDRPHVPLDLGALLHEVVAALSLPANVVIDKPSAWPTVTTERTLLWQIFQNLILNAVKFNRASPKRVWLGWRPLGDMHYEIFVRDNGIGMNPQYHERIFRMFQRLHTTQEFEGTGIGLAIVKKAVGKLGGTIRVESTVDRGSTFWLTLPVAPDKEIV